MGLTGGYLSFFSRALFVPRYLGGSFLTVIFQLRWISWLEYSFALFLGYLGAQEVICYSCFWDHSTSLGTRYDGRHSGFFLQAPPRFLPFYFMSFYYTTYLHLLL